MPKRTIAVLAVVLVGTASAADWRSLRIDGSSEATFTQSVGVFQEELAPAHRYVFESALQDIWIQGTQRAEAERRAFTASEYFRQLDGLAYDEVVTLADPTGELAELRYQAGRYNAAQVMRMRGPDPWSTSPWSERLPSVAFSGQ